MRAQISRAYALFLATVVVSAVPTAFAISLADDSFEVSAIQYSSGDLDPANVWVWTNVTYRGDGEAQNVSATLVGVDPVQPPSWTTQTGGGLGRGASQDEPYQVFFDTTVDLTATVVSTTPLSNLRLIATSPSGAQMNGGSGKSASIHMTPRDIEVGGDGQWVATVSQVSGIGTVAYSLEITSTFPEPQATQSVASIPTGESRSFRWMVHSEDPPSPPAGIAVFVNVTLPVPGGGTAQESYLTTLNGPGQPAKGPTTNGAGLPATAAGGAALAAVAAFAAQRYVRRHLRGASGKRGLPFFHRQSPATPRKVSGQDGEAQAEASPLGDANEERRAP